MENRKPPMTVEDLQSQQEAEKQESMKQGPLSYQEAPPKRAAASSGRVPNNIMQTIMSIVLSVALAGGLLYVYADSVQSDLTLVYDTTNEAVAALDETNAAIAAEATRIDNLLNTLTTYAKKSDLTGLATTDQINALQAAIDAMDVNNIDESRLVALEEAVATLTEAIDSWEAPVSVENIDTISASIINSFVVTHSTYDTNVIANYIFTYYLDEPYEGGTNLHNTLNTWQGDFVLKAGVVPSFNLISDGSIYKTTTVTFVVTDKVVAPGETIASVNISVPAEGFWVVDVVKVSDSSTGSTIF